MLVLYVDIMKVWGFWPKNLTLKPVKYLLCDSRAVLVRHSKAQKYLQINCKALHQVAMKFLKCLILLNLY